MIRMWITKASLRLRSVSYRNFSSSSSFWNKGLVLGAYQTKDGADLQLSPTARKFDGLQDGKITASLKSANLTLKPGKCYVFHGLDTQYTSIALVGLGDRDAGYCPHEERDLRRENVRTGVAAGVQALRDIVKDIEVDGCGDPEAAGEGALLRLFVFDELKKIEKRKPEINVSLYQHEDINDSLLKSFADGCHLARGQNITKRLTDMPSNHLTPTLFAEEVKKLFANSKRCSVIVRERPWIQEKKMGAFLSVSQASNEPPIFLELHYRNGPQESPPFALVGKGVTFDTGGANLKPSAGMADMRMDKSGAACVVGALHTLDKLEHCGNVSAFIPLCENMIGGTANKPGDVVTAMNGKTIQIDNTDAEGRLILADALLYAATFKPTGILDLATLTGAMMIALGSGAAGVFSNSTPLWEQLHKAGGRTGDRVWRMPLWKTFRKDMESEFADINNISKKPQAGSCTAAAFLKDFVDHQHYAHLDIAGVASNKDDVPYLGKGMSGRPTRTVVEFLRNLKLPS